MAERPIKKSDREAAKQAEPASAPQSNVPPPIKKADRTDGGPSESQDDGQIDGKVVSWMDDIDGRGNRNKGGKGGGKGRGKGRGKGDAPRGPMNPALMRGPKPSAKVAEPEVPETPEATEAESADTDDTAAAESTGATPTVDTAETVETTEPVAEVPIIDAPEDAPAEETAS